MPCAETGALWLAPDTRRFASMGIGAMHSAASAPFPGVPACAAYMDFVSRLARCQAWCTIVMVRTQLPGGAAVRPIVLSQAQ